MAKAWFAAICLTLGLALAGPPLLFADNNGGTVRVANPQAAPYTGPSGAENIAPTATPTATPSTTQQNASPPPPSEVGGPFAGVNNLVHLLDFRNWHQPQHFSLADPDSWPFIPVPEIATDPNAGTTVGVLAAVLFTDANHQITDIFAPDLETNTTMGPGGTFRFLSYPSEDTQWYLVAGMQTKIMRRVDFDFQTGREHKKWWSFEGRFYWEHDPTERFYGVGNHSSLGNQTNFTTKQLYGLGMFGLNLTQDLQFSYTLRPRWVRIANGAFGSIPSIFALFPHQKGVDGGSEVLNQFVLSYDTRDSIEVPRHGGLALVYFGVADRSFMSSMSYTRFGGELRRYYMINNRITLAGHLFLEWQPADHELPFWSMARLGGEDSLLADQQTLRGYGAGRFLDNNLAVANVEMRTRVWEMDIFGTHGILELAPFFEAGRVGHNMSMNPLSELHSVGGIGIRGIAEPFVVGYVDIGYGGEGTAVFSGINYPF